MLALLLRSPLLAFILGPGASNFRSILNTRLVPGLSTLMAKITCFFFFFLIRLPRASIFFEDVKGKSWKKG